MPTRSSRYLFGILLLALVIRVGFLYKNWNSLEFGASFMQHGEVARNILDGNWFQKNSAYLQQYVADCQQQGTLIDFEDYPPPAKEELTPQYNDEGGYGLFLAAFWKIFGAKRWWYVRVLQVLLDTAMCWVIYQIGKKAFNERVGLLAALLYACFIPGIEMAVRPHRDIWVSFLFILTVYQLVAGTNDGYKLRHFIIIGISAGLVAWMRSTVMPFVFFLVAGLFLLKPWKEATRFSFALLAGFLLVFSPLIIRNYIVFDKFMATRGAFWHAFWGGVGQMPNPYGLHEDDKEIAQLAYKLNPSVQFDTEQYEQTLKAEAVKFIREQPGWYASSVVRRAVVFVFPKAGRMLFFQDSPQQQATGFLNKSVSSYVLVLVDAAMSMLFLTGVWLTRDRWRLLLLLLLPYLFTWITLSPFYVTGRNIANVYFVVLLFASVGVMRVLERWREMDLSKYKNKS
ncbi:MAG: glycosyltransferase family 39 protein [Ignavibacteriales bacterium]|nr:glycosyltransferase family 39 protein [Ignavibacteriales bacterium]